MTFIGLRSVRRAALIAASGVAALVGVGQAAASTAPGVTLAAHDFAAASPAARKGVDGWSFRGVTTAIRSSGATWYLDWASSPGSIVAPAGVHFVPMIWGSGSLTSSNLSMAEKYGPDLLTFNEPDNPSQANMTVGEALSLWPRLEASHLQISSPAVASGAGTPGGWLDEFMKGAGGRHYRVDFIALHWYGADFTTRDAVAQLRSYLVAVHNRYPKLPIWLTEYSLINFGGRPHYPTAAQQAAFVSASIAMLDSLPFVARFAWFALPTSGTSSTGLFAPGAVPTAAGIAFSKAP